VRIASAVVVVVAAACSSSKEPPPKPREVRIEVEKPIPPPPPASSPTSAPLAEDPWNAPLPPPNDDPAADLPSDLASWMPIESTAFQGTWRAYLPSKPNAMPLEDDVTTRPFALHIAKNRGVMSDGRSGREIAFSIDLPCAIMLSPRGTTGPEIGKEILDKKSVAPMFNMLDRIALRFIVKNGKLMVGEGAVGYRRGKTALVCGVMHGEWFMLDDKGQCFKHHVDEPEEVACHWDTANKLVITCPRCWHERYVLFARGNVLLSTHFSRHARPLVADDFDAAKRWAATQRR
jgi:hypothetical protein